MGRQKRSNTIACTVDMTPMIDVVFQLIIFFIVTIKMDQSINENIRLAKAEYGPMIEDEDPRTMVIEVDKRGWISIHGAQLSHAKLAKIMVARAKRHGQFPVLIRADRRTEHKDVRAVMDICSRVGIWKINFAAVKQEAT